LWQSKTSADWRAGFMTTLVILIVLLAAMFVVGFIALKFKPELINQVLASQQRDIAAFIRDSMARRLSYIGGLLTLLALLIPSLSFLFRSENNLASFILLMLSLGVLLILGPDFLYLRDNFGYRINTIFKFYYQAWILLSLAAAFGVAVLSSELRGVASALFTAGLVIVIGTGLVYPLFSLQSKTDNFKAEHPEQRTLDGTAYLANIMPDDYQAFQVMKQVKPGVIAEAVGGQYTEYARFSTFTGLPTVLGWPGHEGQWRDQALQGSRRDDIQTLYTTSDWTTAQQIIDRYNIRYIVVGNLERNTYPVNEEKFSRFLKPFLQKGNLVIYEVP